ncbi:Terpenoid cyclases/protein prenyltransferase alpha-alpha toroid [Penicillium cosmopolitanum]|uniref:Terpenoid cyclases/protein prenyltransferase alpha-alpha toroid n=1 Tax=Penicillium cosmopolitanum TaxID=1131564 RepID=A0A9X0B3W6_9EURO|nr:Terpenoid cyclases/protein prenyltransferase alpha-alpha toroid [Penicillium cosmopolitanum]KAJ5387140.1 Terpenoid cyclases/protein prenyltransferase alpha-alpha toroid [Penicillium cosmopolitanum]
MDITEHEIGSKLPSQEYDQSFLSPPGRFFEPLVCHAESPKELADWIYSDRPQLHIHVVSFRDTTLITTSYVHTLFDAISRSSFWSAWSAVLRGCEDEIPPMVPFERDPLHTLGQNQLKEEYHHFGLVLSGLNLLLFGIRYMVELLFSQDEVDHTIRVPGHYVSKMTEIARHDLAQAVPKSKEPPFLSEGDIVISWWMRTMIRALKPSPERPIMLMNVFNIWRLFPEWFPQDGRGFIGNSFFYSYTLLSSGKVLRDESLSYTASENRHALMKHRTREQVQAMTAIQRDSYKRTAPVIGRTNNFFMACTNQQMSGNFNADFSGAVIKSGVPMSNRAHAPGQPSYINDIEHCRSYPTRNVVRILGKDAAGDWWLLFKTRVGAWQDIHQQLMSVYEKSDPKIESELTSITKN